MPAAGRWADPHLSAADWTTAQPREAEMTQRMPASLSNKECFTISDIPYMLFGAGKSTNGQVKCLKIRYT